MRCAIIIPYFGKLPPFFELFLVSCAYNKDFDWLIYTDDHQIYQYPFNVKVKYTSFTEFKNKIKSKFDFNIVIDRPHKLCDYKVAYGYIFEDEIQKYDYWGHGDLDLVYGDLNAFLSSFMEEGYDKIYSLGHLSIYKNEFNINRVFMTSIGSVSPYKQVFSSDFGYAFDEWHCKLGSINQIFEKLELKFYKYNECANLDSKYNGFKLSNYIINFGNYVVDSNSKNIFSYKEGKLYRHYIKFNALKMKEYPYIHFHKRNMRIDTKDFRNFLIVPNSFGVHQEITIDIVKKLSKVSVFNKQLFKTKIINLRYRLMQMLK